MNEPTGSAFPSKDVLWRLIKRLMPLIGIALLVWLLERLGLENLVREIRTADLVCLGCSLLLTPVIIVFQVFRWQLFLLFPGIQLPFCTVLFHSLLGQFYGFITPGKIGSFVRISLIADSTDAPLAPRFQSVLLDRLSDLFGMGLLGAGGAVLLTFRSRQVMVAWMVAAVLASCVVGVGFLVVRHRRRVLGAVRFILPGWAQERFDDIRKQMFFPSPRTWVLPLFLAFASWFLVYLQAWLVGLSIDVDIPWWEFVLVMPIAGLVGLIPITISGFGTRDSMVVALAGLYSVAAPKALGLSLMAYSVNALVPAVVGALVALTQVVKRHPPRRSTDEGFRT